MGFYVRFSSIATLSNLCVYKSFCFRTNIFKFWIFGPKRCKFTWYNILCPVWKFRKLCLWYLISKFWSMTKFAYWIFVMIFFSKLRKRILINKNKYIGQKMFLTNEKFATSVGKKIVKKHNKYYVIFNIQTSSYCKIDWWDAHTT